MSCLLLQVCTLSSAYLFAAALLLLLLRPLRELLLLHISVRLYTGQRSFVAAALLLSVYDSDCPD
jgi:hypothetical protein